MRRSSDRILLSIVAILVFGGLFILTSASIGLLTRDGGLNFYSVILRQLTVGIIIGGALLIIASKIKYQNWKRFAPHLFIGSLILTALVFVPSVGFTYGGATRWLSFGPISFQPAELIKLSFVIFFSTWLVGRRGASLKWKNGLMQFIAFLAPIGVLLYLQPDIGTFGVIAITGSAMYLIAGGTMRHIFALIFIGLVFLGILFIVKPHVRSRVLVFLNPIKDLQGSGYQLNQAKIAIGSGGFWGRGFGRSLQKFNYLPEPIGDSIYAVFAEEFGFAGSLLLIGVFLAFAYRGFVTSIRAPDNFGRLLGSGIVILIVSQAFINIAAMVGIVPLTGLPLTFISQGGSSLAIAFIEVGIILNISKYT